MLTFGTYLNFSRLWEHETSEGLYKEMLDISVKADQLGFDIIWTPEHHLVSLLQAPNALLIAAYVGQHVKCRVGTAVSVLPYHHPLMMAGEAAAVDNMLDGRLEFGVARGAYRYEYDRFQQDEATIKDKFIESLEIIDKAFRSEKVFSHSGTFYQFDASKVWPRPVQKPMPPIWVGAQSAPTAAWAAHKGYHASHARFANTVDKLKVVADSFHSAREEVGYKRGELRFAALETTYVAKSRADLREKVQLLAARNRMHHHLNNYDQSTNDSGYIFPHPYEGEPDIDVLSKIWLTGSPDEVQERLYAVEAAGVDHVICQWTWGIPTSEGIASMERFATQVMAPYRASRTTPTSTTQVPT
jgi:flavin-dependent trigonelline monooxygenase, oxygenase component